jgi:hypothetical protein
VNARTNNGDTQTARDTRNNARANGVRISTLQRAKQRVDDTRKNACDSAHDVQESLTNIMFILSILIPKTFKSE